MTARSLRLILTVAFVVGVLLAPFVLSTFAITLMNYVGIYSIATLGLVLLTGAGGLTSFGQAAFFGIGAYTTAYLTVAHGWSPWLGLMMAIAITFVVAITLGYVTLHLGGHYLPITTIAWGVAIYLVFGSIEAFGRYGGMTHIPSLSVFGISLEPMERLYYLIWLIVGLTILAAVNLVRSRQGRAIRALRGGAVLAESLGIDSFRIKLALFVISGLLAALAGWLYAHMLHFISPAIFDLRAGIEFLLMAVLGGSGYVGGALIGAMTITLVKNWLQDVLPLFTSSGGNLEVIVFGALFILLLQYSPRGLTPLILSGADRLRSALGWSLKAGDGKADVSSGRIGGVDMKGGRSTVRRSMPDVGSVLMKIDNLTCRFGGLVAVDGVSFELHAGEIFALIGPNGAGKSTTFNLVSGVLKPTDGQIQLNGRDITGMSQRGIAALGVARTFQHVKLRPKMSLLENVMLGAYARTLTGYLAGALQFDREDEACVASIAQQTLAQVGLSEKADELAGNLPLGQQRLLEIARALAADPIMIMLDEPAAGLRSLEKQALAKLLQELRAQGRTIMLVEHDMEFLMSLTDRIVVLNFGCKIEQGTPKQIRDSKAVQDAYLGGGV